MHKTHIALVMFLVGCFLVLVSGCGLMDGVVAALESRQSSSGTLSPGSWTFPGSVGTDPTQSSTYLSSPATLNYTPPVSMSGSLP